MLVAFQQFVALAVFLVVWASRLLVWRGVAQLVEHWFPKPAVAGSSPSAPALFGWLRWFDESCRVVGLSVQWNVRLTQRRFFGVAVN